jgi:hypothetical protein
MICKNCGIEISDDSKFCVGCGIAIEQPAVETEPEVVVAPVVEAEPVVAQPIYQQPVYAEPAKKEITEDDLPDHLKPMGAWSYFGLQLLFAIPIVGFVFLIVFSFSRGNLNSRSFARSYWCAALVGVAVFVVIMIFALVLGISAMDIADEFRYY